MAAAMLGAKCFKPWTPGSSILFLSPYTHKMMLIITDCWPSNKKAKVIRVILLHPTFSGTHNGTAQRLCLTEKLGEFNFTHDTAVCSTPLQVLVSCLSRLLNDAVSIIECGLTGEAEALGEYLPYKSLMT
jgi:hypothetical protein